LKRLKGKNYLKNMVLKLFFFQKELTLKLRQAKVLTVGLQLLGSPIG
jgi:molybdopterin/thiamine biosynthesis adenylyltransferase